MAAKSVKGMKIAIKLKKVLPPYFVQFLDDGRIDKTPITEIVHVMLSCDFLLHLDGIYT